MTIILNNRDKMFSIFRLEDSYYMTVVAGGVAQYGITISLSKEDADELIADQARAEKLAFRLTEAPDAFDDRRVRPSIAPR